MRKDKPHPVLPDLCFSPDWVLLGNDWISWREGGRGVELLGEGEQGTNMMLQW